MTFSVLRLDVKAKVYARNPVSSQSMTTIYSGTILLQSDMFITTVLSPQICSSYSLLTYFIELNPILLFHSHAKSFRHGTLPSTYIQNAIFFNILWW